MPFHELAHRTGLSQSAVRNRVHNLVASTAVRVGAVVKRRGTAGRSPSASASGSAQAAGRPPIRSVSCRASSSSPARSAGTTSSGPSSPIRRPQCSGYSSGCGRSTVW
ncbi:AsnC family protein [Prescottella defluvii]|nr:AsnC family protein [Prescottella defluvii]